MRARLIHRIGVLAVVLASACAISHTDEIRMGAEYADELNRQLPIVQDVQLNRYIASLGGSIARPADTRNLDWHFYLVDSKEVNAFAVPGGFVYVTRGLVERTTTMSQLSGALGHEIAHVTRRHSVKELERAQRANVGVSVACVLTGVCESEVVRAGVEIGGAAVFAGYSREAEAEADADAVQNVVRAGISPVGIPELLAKLLEERKERPEGVAAWFATHPAEESRITRAQDAIAALDAAVLRTLVADTPEFRAFRTRFLGLPMTSAKSPVGSERSTPR